jgi:hypothetical protein
LPIGAINYCEATWMWLRQRLVGQNLRFPCAALPCWFQLAILAIIEMLEDKNMVSNSYDLSEEQPAACCRTVAIQILSRGRFFNLSLNRLTMERALAPPASRKAISRPNFLGAHEAIKRQG